MLGNQLLSRAEVPRLVANHALLAGHQHVQEVVDHDRHLDAINRGEHAPILRVISRCAGCSGRSQFELHLAHIDRNTSAGVSDGSIAANTWAPASMSSAVWKYCITTAVPCSASNRIVIPVLGTPGGGPSDSRTRSRSPSIRSRVA